MFIFTWPDQTAPYLIQEDARPFVLGTARRCQKKEKKKDRAGVRLKASAHTGRRANVLGRRRRARRWVQASVQTGERGRRRLAGTAGHAGVKKKNRAPVFVGACIHGGFCEPTLGSRRRRGGGALQADGVGTRQAETRGAHGQAEAHAQQAEAGTAIGRHGGARNVGAGGSEMLGNMEMLGTQISLHDHATRRVGRSRQEANTPVF